MDDHIDDFGEAGHQPILDDMRECMGFAERGSGVDPQMQIDEHIVSRAARPDLFAADHARHRLDDAADVLLGEHDFIGEDA